MYENNNYMNLDAHFQKILFEKGARGYGLYSTGSEHDLWHAVMCKV